MFVHTAAALTIITVLAKKELEINAFILQSTATAVTSKTNPGSREVAGRTGTHALSCSSGQNQAEERDGDDQRLFWDRALQVLEDELGCEGTDLSRVRDFVAHNRDGITPVAPTHSYKATGLYFPGLEAKPWWGRAEFPWLHELEDAAADITEEMDTLARGGRVGDSYQSGTGEMSTVYSATQGWSTMRIRYMGRYRQPGVNYALLPRTLSVLRRIPLAPETAAFQRQLPGTGLPLHVDPSNFVLGCHVGIVIPCPAAVEKRGPGGNEGEAGLDAGRGDRYRSRNEISINRPVEGEGSLEELFRNSGRKRSTSSGQGFGGVTLSSSGVDRGGGNKKLMKRPIGTAPKNAISGDGAGSVRRALNDTGDEVEGQTAWMEVAGERRSWETGRAFVFDPSFLHCTHNPTLGERIILNLDVWHPGLSEVERTAIQRVCELVELWNTRSGLFSS